jgi:uncharacterized protein
MRILLLLIIAGIALLLISRALGNARQAMQQKEANQNLGRNKTITIVQCAHCGVHIPENEAVHYQNKTWCSLEHAQAANKV